MSDKPKKILIADDDRTLVQMLSLTLKNAGYEVVAATDGYFAFTQILSEKPDLVILDIHMPAGTGFNVQERIYKMATFGDVPIIYVSGDTSAQTQQAAQQFGAYALIAKPFDMQHLLDTVDGALRVTV